MLISDSSIFFGREEAKKFLISFLNETPKGERTVTTLDGLGR